MNFVKQVEKWLEERKIFSRKRKSNKQRALGMLLYQKGRELFEQSTVKKKRKRVAVDEKELTINGTTIFIWDAVDLGDEKVIAVWVSFGRSGLEAKSFLKKVKSVCKGRLPRIFIDGGSWYPWALNVVRFKRYTVVSNKTILERLYWKIQQRQHGAMD